MLSSIRQWLKKKFPFSRKKKVQILLSADDGDFSKAIRTITKSKYSHAAIIEGDEVVEALASTGVSINKLSDAKARSEYWTVVEFYHPNPEKVYSIARSLVGTPYDKLWVASFALNKRLQNNQHFVCSEFVAHCLQAAGKKLFRDDDYSRVIPDTFYMLHPDI